MSDEQADHGRPTLLRRLLRARVIQTLAIYLPVGWIATEIITTATPQFGLPQWLPGLAMVILIAGIPVVAYLSWAFQITDGGIRTEVKSLRGSLAITVALALLLGVGTLLFQQLQIGRNPVRGAADFASLMSRPVASISILPFEGADPDGLGRVFSGEISERLSRHGDLFVAASNAFTDVRAASLAPVIADRQSGIASYRLTGNIVEDGDAYRLNLVLRDGDGNEAWRDDTPFGRDSESQRALQRRVSRTLAGVLGTRTPTAEYCEPSANIEALENYHTARLRLNQRGPDNLAEAETLLKRAVELDPDYGRAYSTLAIHALLTRRRELAVELSKKALSKCRTLGAAYKIWVPPYEGIKNHYIDQELQWRDALAMEPNHLWMLDNYAQTLVSLGQLDKALRIAERTFRNNPADPRAVVSFGWGFHQMGDFEQALRYADRAAALGDESCNHQLLRWVASGQRLEDRDRALEAFQAVPEHCQSPAMRAIHRALGSETVVLARFDAEIRRQVLDFLEQQIDEFPNLVMLQGIQLNDPDLAHRAVRKSLEQASYIHYPGFWMPIEGARLFRRDPRFVELVKELGFDEYWREFGWPSLGMCTPFADSFVCDK